MDKCIGCKVCVRQCSNEAHVYDPEDDTVYSDEMKCVDCQRCVVFCPTRALRVRNYPLEFRPNGNWTKDAINAIYKQAETGGILLTGMGNDGSTRCTGTGSSSTPAR